MASDSAQTLDETVDVSLGGETQGSGDTTMDVQLVDSQDQIQVCILHLSMNVLINCLILVFKAKCVHVSILGKNQQKNVMHGIRSKTISA